MADYVHTLTNSVVFNTRFGWTRFADYEQRESTGFDMTSIGFPPSVAAASLQPVLPLVTFGDTTTALGPTGGNRAGAGFDEVFDSYQWFTSANMQRGTHALKVGADIRFLREVAMNYGNSAGTYTFGTQWTRGPLDNAAGAPHGQALASFLLGLPTAGGFDVETQVDSRSTSAAFFVQDDWRATSELTLNLGLRYELEAGTTEKNNGLVAGFDAAAVNRVTAAARAAYAANPHPDLPASAFDPSGGLRVRERRSPSGLQHAAQSAVAAHRRRVHARRSGPEHRVPGRLRALLPHLRHHRHQPAGVCADDRIRCHQRRIPAPVRDPVQSVSERNSAAGRQCARRRSESRAVGEYYNPDTRPSYSRRYTIGLQQRLPAGMALEASYQYNQARGLPVNDNLNFIPAIT